MLPRFLIDFNEMVEADLVLLSQADVRLDVNGLPVRLSKGMRIEVTEDALVARGTAEPNVDGPDWTRAAAWCCRIDADGIRREAEL